MCVCQLCINIIVNIFCLVLELEEDDFSAFDDENEGDDLRSLGTYVLCFYCLFVCFIIC